MRIVIVEDEIKTRTGLEKIIHKYTAHSVVASACDGEAGLKLAEEMTPDVVFTDIKMPKMDGITMLEQMRKRNIQSRVILLTGFSDFEYARKSLQLEADDYLLKPLDVEDIIRALDRVSKKIEKIKSETVTEQQLVFSILSADKDKKEKFVKQLEQQMLIVPGENISLFLIQVSSIMEMTVNEVLTLLEETLPMICLVRYFIFRMPDKHRILIMILDGQKEKYLKQLFAMHVIPEINKIGECLVEYDQLDELKNFSEKTNEMIQNFEYSFGIKKSRILDREIINSCKFEEIEYPKALEQTLRKEIRSGSTEKLKGLAKKFQETIIESSARPSCIKEYTVRFMMLAVNGVRERKNESEQESLYHTLFDQIMNSDTREKLVYEYWKIWNGLVCEKNGEENTHNSSILNVIELIRNNYDKDISLSEAADYVGLTPEYLSKLFAKEMGINFSTFLGDFRISRAKQMLIEGQMKIYEIAEAVGYRDTKYFNKVFRAVTGISPSEYRKGIR